MNAGELTDTAGVSARIGTPARTLEDWRYKGVGPPFYKLASGAIRYSLTELEAWLTQHRKAS